MRRRAPWALAAAVVTLAARAHAQSPAAPRPPPAAAAPIDRMAGDERLLFGLLTTTYGLRLGTAINLGAFGRAFDDPEPETYWILPGALAVAVPVGALLLERRFPLRRGRGIAAGSGGLLGYLAMASLSSWMARDAFPSGATLSGWSTFLGTTGGIAVGALVGHLTDAPPADVLFVATGGVGGALVGGLLCGALRCGPDLGAWALAGELGFFGAALALRATVRPTQPTMRLVGIGALGLGVIMGGGVLLAHGVRDGELTPLGIQRSAAFGLGGLVLGAAIFYALGRSAEPGTTVAPTAQVTGQGMVLGVAVTHR